MVQILDNLNSAVQNSFVGRYFELENRKTTFCNEFRGAAATFMSMAYILAVNPRILADSGGPCVPSPADEGGIFSPDYEACKQNIMREYVSSTAIASLFGCLFMGILGNLPIALAPGMGMNAYFTYSVVGWRGTGSVSYESAVTAVMIEGAIFFLLAITGARYAIVKCIPEPVRLATPAAIGFFLAHLGLQTSEGLGVVVSDVATAVTLGGCALEDRVYITALTDACKADSAACVTSDAYTCDETPGSKMTSATTWMGLFGMSIMCVMTAYKNRSAFICGIAVITFFSWFRNTEFTYFPDTPAGNERFDYFTQIVRVEPLNSVFAPFTNELSGVGVALFTFLYVDFLDTSGTLLALVGNMGYIDENGDFPNSRMAFAADAVATMFGSIFGLSPVTSYIESGSGVEAGARTGLTSCFCGFFFFLSIFFAPIIASIPPWATGGALVLVGALMSKSLGDVKWYDTRDAVTAFLTVIIMPLTYSIAYGLIAGIGAYLIFTLVYKGLALVGIPEPLGVKPEEDALEVFLRKQEEKSLEKEAAIVPDSTVHVPEHDSDNPESGEKRSTDDDEDDAASA